MFETVLGVDVFSKKEVVVSDYIRQSGMYVVGVQGMGKSSFISHLIHEDILKNYPIIVIDPHGDLISDVVAQMPGEAVKRTFLLDLDDIDYPFALNLFALKAGEAGDIRLRQMAIDRIIHVIERLFPSESRMLLERLLRVIVQTLADNPGCSMGDIPRLLHDDKFRSRLVKNTTRRAREYWELEYNPASASNRSRVATPLATRIASLLDNPMVENIVCQETSSIDFRRSINNKEIILIKLPVNEFQGIAPIIGTMLIAEIYRATFSFRDIEQALRPGFSLYVDEFQNFSTKDFAELFTQGRKFGVRMTVGHQYREQLTDDNKHSTLTADVLVSFRVVHSDARELSSSFVSQEAVIAEKVVFPDVLKHLSTHPSQRVKAFQSSYIQPLMLRTKEPCMRLPSILPQFQTIGEVLRFLEELMYLVETQGGIYENGDSEGVHVAKHIVSKYVDYLDTASCLLGFYDVALDTNKAHPKRKQLQNQAQEKIAKLEEELAKKRAVLESDYCFSRPSCKYVPFEWQKEVNLVSKRQGVLELLRSMLNHSIGKTLTLGASLDTTRDELEAMARENSQLTAFDTPEKICAIRRSLVGEMLSKREKERDELLRKFCQMIGWRGSASPIQYENGIPGLYRNNCIKCVSEHIRGYKLRDSKRRREAEGVCHDVVRIDEAIYEIEKDQLQAKNMRGNPFEPASLEAIAEFCKFLSTLNTPQKVLDAFKSDYDLLNLAPLREQIAKVQEKLEADLASFEKQIEAQRPLFERFNDGLFYCLADLARLPLCEQKILTASDTANILEHLDKRFALCRTGESEQGESEAGVFLMQTLDTPERVEKSVFDARMRDIRTRTRGVYCRSRLEIEQELETQKSGLSEDEELNTVDEIDVNAGGLDLVRFED